MESPAQDLARRLGRNAEVVCQHYLPKGQRAGAYWLVGSVDGSAGRSLYVRLTGPEQGKGAAGRWTDAATDQHGDLLDLIALNRGLARFHDVLDEARAFLRLPHPINSRAVPTMPTKTHAANTSDSARRLFSMSKPIGGTIAATYLRHRGITALRGLDSLRFHPTCFYRPDPDLPVETWPALIAAVTDLAGKLCGVQRTWLNPSGQDKAPIKTPRRAMGLLLGNAVRFGMPIDVLAAGEGIETMLSLRTELPRMPMAAALTGAHLSALILPSGLKRLYIAQDRDSAGAAATAKLTARARELGIQVLPLLPIDGDFNDDQRFASREARRVNLHSQLDPSDVVRFQGP
jgi:hypothetical protein